MQFKKHTTFLNNRKVSYWEKNPSKRGILVLLHGFPGNHRVIMDMAQNFENYRVVLPDLPACGESEPFEGKHSLNNYAEWVDGFLESLAISKAVVVGYSFGSRVAVTFCDTHEEKVEKLVLITPVVRPGSFIARAALLEYKIAEILPDFLKKSWLENKVYKTASNMIIFKSSSKNRRKKLMAEDKKEADHLYPRATVELFNEFASAKPISEGRKINTKTLLIACDLDEIATVESVKELSVRFSNSELKIIKKSGHIVPGEQPKTVAKIISNWLA